jgi:arsenate reductase-like glutaredoxin family protein
MNVQIFGTNKSQDTKKALRFFKERGLKPQFVDLQRREIALGELNRFIQKFGLNALVDTTSKAYKDAGLEYLRVSNEHMIQKLIDDPRLMVQPLLRSGPMLAVGWDEKLWRDWHKEVGTKELGK